MKCPQCSAEMKTFDQDVSYNFDENDKPNKSYDRTKYHCVADDIWAVIEIPKANI